MRELNMRSDLVTAATRAIIARYDEYYLHQGILSYYRIPARCRVLSCMPPGNFGCLPAATWVPSAIEMRYRCIILGAARLSGLALRATHG